MIKLDIKNFIHFPTVWNITQRGNLFHIVWRDGKESWVVKEITLDESLMWLVGFWMGDRTSVNRGFGIGTIKNRIKVKFI
jgi:hypothetical protein